MVLVTGCRSEWIVEDNCAERAVLCLRAGREVLHSLQKLAVHESSRGSDVVSVGRIRLGHDQP